MPIGCTEVVVSQLLVRIHGILRRRPAFSALLCALLLPAGIQLLHAQVVPPIVLEHVEEVPPQYEATIRDLVERYEDLRERLRVEIRRNEDMFTRAEMEAAVRDLERDLERSRARTAALEAQLKESLVRHRLAEEKSRGYKAAMLKMEDGLLRELETTRSIVDAMQVEHIFQVGPTFSPAGTLGALGVINIPGTRLSLVGGTQYDLRDQDLTTLFGVTFRFLSQRSIVETWIRLQNRRDRQKAQLTEEELRMVRNRRR